MDRQVRVQWTRTARDMLAKLPKKNRSMILAKTKALADTDLTQAHKPLVGPLRGYYSIKTSRYRTLHQVTEDRLANGDVLISVKVLIVATGKREEGDRKDVYSLAEKLLRHARNEIDDVPDENE